ncbi:aminotransferase class V-fold PLP-dependent enzyme [Maribellus comscasis]|uniref:Aminotransferase class V-fold PLP-dependent enzyme n=1 Tax=Maribellus comscasis TaxID=2681766 RepID=A0A6I6JWG9_9BACT|nr:aminotransferase class V-fold PLP-dependent enzyme [Maribellus comscasis]QGY45470.1 aminotransferase class V-fold PLP-dependent enzyme [Maribellus comscasis]
MVNWNKVREEFPVCKKYVYLNPAGGSPVSNSAATEGKRFYDEMLEFGDTYWDTWLERTEKIRSNLAGFIGAEKVEIGFTTNTSHGMNLVAQFLKNKGTVLTMRDEFPSTTFPWLNQKAEIKFAEPVENAFPLNEIEKAITPDVKILMTSYVQYKTGFRQDLEALGKLCKRKNLIFVVNATQALGIFPVDVKKCNIDFLMFTGLKWATAGYGIGGLYINKKWLKKEDFPFAGWRSVKEPEKMDNTDLDLKNEASVIESGCPHFPNIFALGGALEMFKKIGAENVVNRVLFLNHFLEDELTKIDVGVICQTEDKHRSGILIARVPNAKRIVEELSKKNIIVSARGEGVRISTSIFNNQEDIEILIRELKTLLN